MPNRKVIDILPPKESTVDLKREDLEEPYIEEAQRRKRAGIGKGLIFSLVILILLGVFAYLTMSKAEIDLWPETETLYLEKELTVSKDEGQVNVSSGVIPAQVFQKEKQVTDVFQSSGKVLKEEKAKGIIRVYNAYSTSSQVLVATTRFVAADGKVFRTPVMVTIPGGRYEGGKFIPGEIDIEVFADQPGPEYNIGRTTFSIPGFAGSDRYTKFYAMSSESMAGGFREEIAVVTKEDFDRAEESLSVRAKQECEELLTKELSSEEISSKYNSLDKFLVKITEKFSLANVGDEAEEFKLQVKANCETLLFQKDDIRNFAKDLISSQASQGYKIYEESLKADYLAQTIDLEAGRVVILLNAFAKAYSEVNMRSLKDALSGKSLLETKLFLESQPKITKVNVKFWPFWVRSVPDNPDKVEININID